MNKRQRKKLDYKLIIAIRELNNDIAMDEGFPPIKDSEILVTLERVKKSKNSINQTLSSYRKLVREE